MPKALISCATAEHYTPATYVEAARVVLGGIDLDPASCALANRCVQAQRFYTAAEDGLVRPWGGRIFINSPGDRSGNLVRAFWSRANEQVHYGGPGTAVIWMGFSFNQFDTLQACPPMATGRPPRPPQAWPRVEKQGRISWESPTATIELEGTASASGRLSLQIGEAKPILLYVLKTWRSTTIAKQLAARLNRVGFENTVTTHLRQKRPDDPLVKLRFKVAPDIPVTLVEKNVPGLKCRVGRNNQPTQGNWFCLLGGDKAMRRRFRERFSEFGEYSPGRPWQPPRQLVAEVLAAIRAHGPMSKRAVSKAIGARWSDVSEAIDTLSQRGQLTTLNRKFALP